MKKSLWIYFLIFALINLTSCGNSTETVDELEGYYSEDEGYTDGTYCAEVTYYNPNTGTNSTYTLEVEVSANQVVKIYWGNGGWMDEDHFSAQDLDADGRCSFTSDKGYDYTVEIIGTDCGHTDVSTFQDDVSDDEQAVTCPKCGDEKYEYDEYCYRCQRKIDDQEDNTCSRCGKLEYGVYGGICSDCQAEDEEENQ